MKSTRSLLPLLIVFVSFISFVPADTPDAVVGTWLNGSKEGHIQIYKQGGTFFGRLTYLAEPNDPVTGKPKVDAKNGDIAKRTRPLLNLPLMYNFRYDGNNVWSDGKIYNPEDGKEYNCRMTLRNPNTLDVRGYVGISLLGKTQTWTRIK